MGTREELVQRHGVRPEDVDDIIGIASELSDQEREQRAQPTVDEVREVARELDIEPHHVDEAVRVLQRRREEQAAHERLEAERAQTRRRALGLAAMAVAGAVGLVLVALLGGALVADASLDGARADERRTASNLEVVLERQATLAPQLVALAGGSSGELVALASELNQAPDVPAKLAASDRLGLAMATALGQLPPATDPATQQSRADLQHEVSGISNRITVERRRWEEARSDYEAEQDGFFPGLALTLGLHP